MKLGLVGWPSDTGVGMELKDALRYLPVESVFYMDHIGKPLSSDFVGRTAGVGDLSKKMDAFLQSSKVDTILSWETPGAWEFPDLWQRRGVRWFCVVHWDWFAPKQVEAWKKGRLIAPFHAAQIGLELIYGLKSTQLQVPVDTERIPYRQRGKAQKFMTVYGHGGPADRRAIREIVEAWRLMGDQAPSLEVFAQRPIKELEGVQIPIQVNIKIGNLPKVADLYSRADVAVLPSKYEGVGLSLIEAQAAGLPVITTDMDPMRRIAPEYLVSGQTGDLEIMEGHKLSICTPNPISIAGRVKELVNQDISDSSRRARHRIQESYSWQALAGDWLKLLGVA